MTTYEEIEKTKKDLHLLKRDVEEKLLKIQQIEKSIINQDTVLDEISKTLDQKISGLIESEPFKIFFKKPYCPIPYGKNKLLIAVPKFIKGFQVGWLYKETENFYIYQLDQYSAWLGDVPQELSGELKLEQPLDVNIVGQDLFFDTSQKDRVKEILKKHIKNIGENNARIIQGHEFQILADMVKNNTLPFKPKPVEKQDLREGKSGIELHEYQKKPYDNFFKFGTVGFFHPTGSGKSFITMKILDVLKGKKAIIVPTRSLIEQWNYYISEHLPHLKHEIEIYTYHSWTKIKDKEFTLVIFDEVHRLPGNTFSRFAFIKSKYRIGLSASPYREDGREDFIFALTGYPQGLDWESYLKASNRDYHIVNVYVLKTELQKHKKALSLVDKNKKTLIFTDKLEPGRKVAEALGVPFIHGNSDNRLEAVKNNHIFVASRVLDMGVSIDDLDHIIEIDFLFGSRNQELQRTGRLMHSNSKNKKHDILMTEEEMARFGKRLYALREKGFKLNVYEDNSK